MVDQLVIADDVNVPDASQLITEDDTPVDNFPSEKQQRLLTSCLYSNLKDQQFIAAANVGIYHTAKVPAIVPDVFVSFNVEVPEDWWEKQNRCYLVWNFGKPPEIAIEIVSNKVGKELTEKFTIYEQMRVSYYALYDPSKQLGKKILRLYELRGTHYVEMDQPWLEQVQLGLTVWQGEFEGRVDSWLRWQGADGALLLTGDEQAEAARQQSETERQRAETERQRAEQAQQRAAQEQQRADRLADFLRSQGIDPDQLPE
ncbi:MAG: Uma2 family endonuclease [Cyanobacteria bacterium J06626_18]